MTEELQLPTSVRVVEVGLRDGLQSVTQPLPTEAKVELVSAMVDSGITEIEAVSFAHPAVLPQLADAAEVLAAAPRTPGVRLRGLVPNLRGAQRAAACDLDVWVALVSCDEDVSRINQGRSRDEVVAELRDIGDLARECGVDLVVGLAMSFFAPCAGETDARTRRRLTDAAVEAGARGVYFADTVGMAHPGQIRAALLAARTDHPQLELGLHLHTRNGFALANVLSGLMTGVDWLEAAFCGLGGDLWFPGAPEVLGNLATEDLLAFTAALGVETGVDLGRYQRVSELAACKTGREPLDHVSRGGSKEELAAARWSDLMAGFDGITTARR
ncbi:hydroxymethylglutaryl-CoA lyase [Nocardioides marmotae]|uniref:hydroxymethylglutaryl-CoA lyase n=1 Tax=Nocardioides marmotae TaxID=2663857 RepID=UPI0012B5101F|nr:hydroxymethylglutaryl-CoA lyase [Nocardioides marmotae]MBC9734761.1 hydroxymethylglutaryl-CoA lyase [Nocardioides marmotae]MTB85862.1 hydroxymethylglutaryl-CoA lyase [Nocardioides marmotae]